MPAHHALAPTPDARELRRSAFAVGGAMLALALLARWRGRHATASVCTALGLLLIAAGTAAPARLAPAHRVWMQGATALSRVTTPIFLGIVYFGVLTPIGLVLGLLGRRPLRAPRRGESAWIDRPPDARRGDIRRQF